MSADGKDREREEARMGIYFAEMPGMRKRILGWLLEARAEEADLCFGMLPVSGCGSTRAAKLRAQKSDKSGGVV